MKKAFSTLGCPMWNLKEVLTVAKDLDMDGIEIRGIEYQMYAPKVKAFLDENIDKTTAMIKKLNIEIAMLSTGCDLSNENFNKVIEEAEAYMILAKKLNCKYIRIMCENTPCQKKYLDLKQLSDKYSQICDIAKKYSILPLIETNSILAKSENMLKFLKLTNKENAKVLWDIHHPYRFFNESPQKTVDMLSDYICYIHIKDSVYKNNSVEYKILGSGDIPIKDAINYLKKKNYTGYISLEWVKRWCPKLEESGIVFPQYANYLNDIIL